ncbi:hypothetical protein D9M68_681930 [compost metagenome]
MEPRHGVARRAGAFGKDDQGFAVAQHVGGAVEHVEAFVVGDVAGVGDRPAGKGVRGQAVLDDAVGILDVAHQKDHVQQRGVVGQYHLPGLAQALGAPEFHGQNANAHHEADEQAERPVQGPAGAALAVQRVAGQQALRRENECAQQNAAQPEQGERHASGDEPPEPEVLPVMRGARHAMRVQVHWRAGFACRQACVRSNRWRSRFRGLGQIWDSSAAGAACGASMASVQPVPARRRSATA